MEIETQPEPGSPPAIRESPEPLQPAALYRSLAIHEVADRLQLSPNRSDKPPHLSKTGVLT